MYREKGWKCDWQSSWQETEKIATYVGNYNDDNAATSDNSGPTDSTLLLPSVDIDPIHGEQLNNAIIQSQTQFQLETTTYIIPETFPDVASALDHWDTHISENKIIYGIGWRKGWSGKQK